MIQQSRRAFIRNCGILLAAAIATPAMGTSIAAGAMRLGPAVNLAMMRKAALEQHMNDMERALFFEPTGVSPLAQIVAEQKRQGVKPTHDYRWWEEPEDGQ